MGEEEDRSDVLKSILEKLATIETAVGCVRSTQQDQKEMKEMFDYIKGRLPLQPNGSPQVEQDGSSGGGGALTGPVPAGLLQAPSRSQIRERPYRLMIEGTVGTLVGEGYFVAVMNEPISITVRIVKRDGTHLDGDDPLAYAVVELFALHGSFEYDPGKPWWDPTEIVPRSQKMLSVDLKNNKSQEHLREKEYTEPLTADDLERIKVDAKTFMLKEGCATHALAKIGWSSHRNPIKIGARVCWDSMPYDTRELVTAGVSNAFKVQAARPKGAGSSSRANNTADGSGSSEHNVAPILSFPANAWNASPIQSHQTTPINCKRVRNFQSYCPAGETSENRSVVHTNQGNNQDTLSLDHFLLQSAPDTGGGHCPPQNTMSWDAQNCINSLNLLESCILEDVKCILKDLKQKLSANTGNNDMYRLFLHLQRSFEDIRRKMEEGNVTNIVQMQQPDSWLTLLIQLRNNNGGAICQLLGGQELVCHFDQLQKLLQGLSIPPHLNVPPAGFGTDGGGTGGGHQPEELFQFQGNTHSTYPNNPTSVMRSSGYSNSGDGRSYSHQPAMTGPADAFMRSGYSNSGDGRGFFHQLAMTGPAAGLSGQSFRPPSYARTPNNEEFEYGGPLPKKSKRYIEEKKTFSPGIVEFSSVLVDAGGHLLEPHFHTYVKPIQHTLLSSLCREYNSMTQEDVDGAVLLSEALQMHESWMSCKMLKQECERKGLTLRWIDLNESFVARYHDRYLGRPVKDALEATGGKVRWEGPPKGGRSHVRNKARLLAFLIEKGVPHTIYELPAHTEQDYSGETIENSSAIDTNRGTLAHVLQPTPDTSGGHDPSPSIILPTTVDAEAHLWASDLQAELGHIQMRIEQGPMADARTPLQCSYYILHDIYARTPPRGRRTLPLQGHEHPRRRGAGSTAMATAGAALRLRLLYAAAAALRLAVSLLLNACFVFVPGNAIVLLLLALSRRERDLPAAASSSGQQAATPASPAAPAAAEPTASFDSFAAAAASPGASPEAAAVAPSHPPPPLSAATEELAAPRAFEDQNPASAAARGSRLLARAPRRSRSEKMGAPPQRAAYPPSELRRSESENGRRRRRSSATARDAWGADDVDEFRRTVEAFIAKQMRFHREESMSMAVTVAGGV